MSNSKQGRQSPKSRTKISPRIMVHPQASGAVHRKASNSVSVTNSLGPVSRVKYSRKSELESTLRRKPSEDTGDISHYQSVQLPE
jgi:hypothetical protein